MHQPLIHRIPVRKQSHEACSFGSVAVSIFLLVVAFITVFHDGGLHHNDEQSLGVNSGFEEPVVADFDSSELIEDYDPIEVPASREDMSDDNQQSKLLNLEEAAKPQEDAVGNLEEVPVAVGGAKTPAGEGAKTPAGGGILTPEEYAKIGVYDCQTYQSVLGKEKEIMGLKEAKEFLNNILSIGKEPEVQKAKAEAAAVTEKLAEKSAEVVTDKENLAYTTFAEAFSGTYVAKDMQPGQPDESLGQAGYKAWVDSLNDGKGDLAHHFTPGNGLTATAIDHLNNHLFINNHWDIDHFNPAAVVSVGLTAMLDHIPEFNSVDAAPFKMGVEVAIKVIALAVNINMFGTVWWIAVPLCALSIFLMFMRTEFPEGSETKKVQDYTTTPMKGFFLGIHSGFMDFYKTRMGGDKLNALFGKVKEKAKTFIQWIERSIRDLFKKIGDGASAMLENIAKAVATVMSMSKVQEAKRFVHTALSWSACVGLVWTGLVTFGEKPLPALEEFRKYEAHEVQYRAEWYCKASCYYDPTGNCEAHNNPFNECCKDFTQIDELSKTKGVYLEDIDPANEKGRDIKTICAMWEGCCNAINKPHTANKLWTERYYDVLCCEAAFGQDSFGNWHTGDFGVASFKTDINARYPKIGAYTWAGDTH